MSIYQQTKGVAPIKLFCDGCDRHETIDSGAFSDAISFIKKKRWTTKKFGASWNHYCSTACKRGA